MNYDFDFPHTCPIIDGAYEAIETKIKDAIYESFEDHISNPSVDFEHITRICLKNIIAEIKSDLEAVRDTNIRMRDKADSQLREAEKDYDYMQDWKDQLDKEIDNLKYENKTLEEKIEELNQLLERHEKVHS